MGFFLDTFCSKYSKTGTKMNTFLFFFFTIFLIIYEYIKPLLIKSCLYTEFHRKLLKLFFYRFYLQMQ